MLENYKLSIILAQEIKEHQHEDLILGFPASQRLALLAFARIMLHGDAFTFSISPFLSNSLRNTTNQLYPRMLPFPTLFVDAELDIGTVSIKGIMIAYQTTNESTNNFQLSFLSWEQQIYAFNPSQLKEEWFNRKNKFQRMLDDDVANKKYQLSILYWGLDKSDNTMVFCTDKLTFPHTELTPSLKKMRGFGEMLDKIIPQQVEYEFGDDAEKSHSQLKLYIANLLDFLNHPEVETIKMTQNPEQNEKRIMRGKIPMPLYHLVRVSGKLKSYVDSMTEEEKSTPQKHWVRGHFMRFRDKERFVRLYQLHMEGKLLNQVYLDVDNETLMRWKLPFVRGKGTLIKNPYLVGV